jgi:hypothetical protein
MIMDNFQDHGKLLCLLIHLSFLFLSIEVGGDEYAGSKPEVHFELAFVDTAIHDSDRRCSYSV